MASKGPKLHDVGHIVMVSSIVTGVLSGLETKVAKLEEENVKLRDQVNALHNKLSVL